MRIPRKSAVVMVFALVPVAALGIVTYWSFARQLEASRWVRQTLEVILLARKIDDNLMEMQTGIGGYVLFGEGETARAAEQGHEAFLAGLRELEGLVGDNPNQVVRLGSLRTAAEEWRRGVAEGAIRAVEAGKRSRAVDLARESRRTMQAIRSQMGAFVKAEERLLNERTLATREPIAGRVFS